MPSVPGDDYLQGNAGDDVLAGDRGNDRMVGGLGNDTLWGGVGGDYLVGNEGADIFQYTTVEDSQNIVVNGVSQQDQIADFTQGQDKIDLSAIDANPALAGDQAFVFIADPAHYTGDWTGVVWQTTGANGIATINVSIDGDAHSGDDDLHVASLSIHGGRFHPLARSLASLFAGPVPRVDRPFFQPPLRAAGV
jgi:Ca2+-binding RTX toxin-like protein